jgi:hypothetical protein
MPTIWERSVVAASPFVVAVGHIVLLFFASLSRWETGRGLSLGKREAARDGDEDEERRERAGERELVVMRARG